MEVDKGFVRGLYGVWKVVKRVRCFARAHIWL